MKTPADKFTIDAFDAPRRGRPRKHNAKSNAQRQREFRSRQHSCLSPVQQARQHIRLLTAVSDRLASMSLEWDEVDEYFRSQFEQLAGSFSELHDALVEYVNCNGDLN